MATVFSRENSGVPDYDPDGSHSGINSTYDSERDGVVDKARNADKLGGVAAGNYQQKNQKGAPNGYGSLTPDGEQPENEINEQAIANIIGERVAAGSGISVYFDENFGKTVIVNTRSGSGTSLFSGKAIITGGGTFSIV